MNIRVVPLERDLPKVTVFEKSIRSFQIVLMLFGSWPIESRSCLIRSLHAGYAVSLVALTMYFQIAGLFYFSVHHQFDGSASGLVIIEIWRFQAVACFLIFYASVRNGNLLSRFFQQLDEYFVVYSRSEEEIRNYLNKTRKRVWIFLVTLYAIASMSYLFIAVQYRRIEDIVGASGDTYPFPFTKQQYAGYILQTVLQLVMIFVLMETSLFGMAIFIMVVSILNNEFNVFNQDLRRALEDQCHLDSSRLEALRWRHERLRGLVEQADRTFGKYIAANYITFIPLSCFIFYQLLYKSVDMNVALAVGNFAAFMVVEIVIISFFAVRLAETAQERIIALYSAKADFEDQKIILQLLFLAESMKGHFVGFSVWNALAVTKDTLLAFLGALLTYIVVVADFQR